jgi:hypothetical protein
MYTILIKFSHAFTEYALDLYQKQQDFSKRKMKELIITPFLKGNLLVKLKVYEIFAFGTIPCALTIASTTNRVSMNRSK